MPSFQIAVAEADPLRAERLTRSLKRALDAVEGVIVDYAPPAASNPERAKGGLAHYLLEASVVGAWPVCAPLFAEAVKSWFQRENGGRVRLTFGPDHVDIEGEPTPDQTRLLLALLERQERE